MRKLKNKRLTDFINDVAATIPDPKFQTPVAALTTMPKNNTLIRGSPHSLIDMEREHLLLQWPLGDDEPPLLYVGRRPIKIRRNSTQLKDIVHSFIAFKELSVDMDDQQNECADYG